MNRLAEIKARAAAATEGPWENNGSDTVPIPGVIELDSANRWNSYEPGVDVSDADCEFIAHARTDIPALVAAVEAVLALHKAWAESNPTDTTVSHVCEACLTANGWGEPVPEPFPCPTVTAISAALGEEQ